MDANMSVGKGSARRDRLSTLAKAVGPTLKEDQGSRIAVFDSTPWDTPVHQGTIKGRFANGLARFDTGIGSLKSSLGKVWNKTIVVVVSEFGRTVAVNGAVALNHVRSALCY